MAMNCQAPFQLPLELIQVLKTHSTFLEHSDCLSRLGHTNFCFLHCSLEPFLKETFTTHLSLIQTLLSPLIDLHTKCSTLARTHLTHNPRRKSPPSSPQPQLRLHPIDLELAFRGPSRDAFSWLSVVLVSEPNWARPSPNACPACLTLQSFTGEPYLRMLVAASRLSSLFSSESDSDSSKPSLESVTTVLQPAVTEDEFWGPRGWEEISARAREFEIGIKELLAQCKALETKYPVHVRVAAQTLGAATGGIGIIAPVTDFFSSRSTEPVVGSGLDTNVSSGPAAEKAHRPVLCRVT